MERDERFMVLVRNEYTKGVLHVWFDKDAILKIVNDLKTVFDTLSASIYHINDRFKDRWIVKVNAGELTYFHPSIRSSL